MRRITANTAVRLSYLLGNSAKFCLGLQDDFDIEAELRKRKRNWIKSSVWLQREQ